MRQTNLTRQIARKKRIRARISGSMIRPRVSVFRSNKLIYAQAINDDKSHTLAAAYGKDPVKVGEELGEKILKVKVKKVVFDRSGYKYHGNIKKLADSLRAKGIEL